MLIVDTGLMGTLGFIILFLLLCIFKYFHNKILKIKIKHCYEIVYGNTPRDYLGSGRRIEKENFGILSSDMFCEHLLLL